VLLSTLKGAAVTSVSIEGVAHEFSSIPYVKEDVTEVILNLKGLNLKSFTDDPVRMTLDVTGPREVKASDIQAPSDVEIVNPELYICTLDSNKGRLRMELTVEQGKGYVPAERNKKEGQPIGVIPIDAIFSPVVKANFLIEKTRVGQETDWDKLILEVWTDGTIQPDQAISEAAKQFTSHLGLFTRFTERIKEPIVPETGNGPAARLADVPIEDLDLSVRALNCLKANEITKIGQLVSLREEDLLSLRNFGRKSLDEIKEKLVQRGFLTEEELSKVLN
jgi:DNA-directed RNA polymerase subunit alpha